MLRCIVAAFACVVTLAFAQSASAQVNPVTVSGQIGGPGSPYAWTFSSGPDFAHYSSSYRSTGTQAPRDATSNHTDALLCGGANGYWPLGARTDWNVAYGGGVNYCYAAAGKNDLYNFSIHPANGLVTATVEPRSRIEVFSGFHFAPAGPEATNPFFFMRVGPVFADNKISIRSDQTGGGGTVVTASSSKWNTGLMVELGYATQPLCGSCMFGNSVRLTMSGKAYWFGSGPSVTAHSSTFGFDETSKIESSRELSLSFGLSSPIKF
jgi:hypothetical protein